MIRRREAFFIAVIIAALLPTQAMSASILSGNSSPLCLVPVKNGEPTKADIYQSFRLTSKVVVVRGLDRPIIFPLNRGGVWTIDTTGAYVPFGGDFPDHYQDQYATDTSTGDVIGVSWKLGVFRLRPGETQFERLFAADGKPFVHPFSAAYVARLGGTVISDNSGLYLLRPSGQVERLYWDTRVGGKSPGRVFDLPELKLLLFTAEGYIYARDDNGNLTIFDKGFGGVQAARVTADRRIFLERIDQNLVVPWPPKDPTRPAAQQATHTYENFEGIETYVGTLVRVHDKQMSVDLPQRVYNPPTEFPGGVMVANAGNDGLYTLNAENRWDFVDQSREIAGNVIYLFQLPIENQAVLVNGREGLFLLVRKTDARAVACLR
ncbi:hypothetical protein N1937_11480 [Rhizobium sp. WSM4643]|uniref:hypothetical protein n=1 Tax=Rhizobium sp. WSM4643 TaxID=3138253 RepID=UPI0021A8E454|nr:hypothetical protein [Rhizobium leguminosarum]UWM77793.1 hypothetical protein N1937_11480 [Rhizobium leguminosarum bv. viciae]